jgi:linoleoyl-CoA desaturase
MTGNLSHQIEHHLFPDMPSNRYIEIAPRIREICQRYGLSYTTGSVAQQVFSAWKQVVKLSVPNGFTGRFRRRQAGAVQAAVQPAVQAAPA